MPRLGLWIGASSIDIGIRLVAQMAATVVIARLSSPEDFGLAMLALSVAALLGAFIGQPFEEALAQRPRITTGHLGTALCSSLVLAVAALAIVLLVSAPLGDWIGAPGLGLWLPLATAFLLAQGPGSITRALARRQRKFVELAVCQSLSVVVATIVAIVLAMAGAGVLALILQRMLPVVLYPVLGAGVALARGRAPVVLPVFIRTCFDDLFRFSWIYLGNTAIHYAIPAAMTFLVNMLFGTRVLGQVNIAMRLAEPLRQGIQGVGHNLAFSMLARLRAEPRALVRESLEVVTRVASIAVPAFLGLAIVAPFALPILAGPGWEAAIPLAQAFCVMAAVNAPLLYVFSGFSALGKPEYELAACILGLVAMVGLLLLAARAAMPLGIGLAMLGSEIVLNGVGLVAASFYLGTGILQPLFRLLRVWIASGLMALTLAGAVSRIGVLEAPIPALLATVAGGLLLYPPLLFLFCRPCFRFLESMLLRRRRAAA